MRALRSLATALAAAIAALAAASCGSGGSDGGVRALAPVRLTVTKPADSATTRAGTLTVRGSVEPPDAAVRVLGQSAEVVAGAFTARVDLDPGVNVIDLAATAPQHDPALTAFRVTREMPVTVPDLTGLTPDDARAELDALGLDLVEHDGGGLFDGLIPGDPGVCEQDPGAGEAVRRGTSVEVLVAKRC